MILRLRLAQSATAVRYSLARELANGSVRVDWIQPHATGPWIQPRATDDGASTPKRVLRCRLNACRGKVRPSESEPWKSSTAVRVRTAVRMNSCRGKVLNEFMPLNSTAVRVRTLRANAPGDPRPARARPAVPPPEWGGRAGACCLHGRRRVPCIGDRTGALLARATERCLHRAPHRSAACTGDGTLLA